MSLRSSVVATLTSIKFYLFQGEKKNTKLRFKSNEYKIETIRSDIAQVGWITPSKFQCDHVGDDANSWWLDGYRYAIWFGSQPCFFLRQQTWWVDWSFAKRSRIPDSVIFKFILIKSAMASESKMDALYKFIVEDLADFSLQPAISCVNNYGNQATFLLSCISENLSETNWQVLENTCKMSFFVASLT